MLSGKMTVTEPEWICPDCRSLCPTPKTYWVSCGECAGTGFVSRNHHCTGCDDHACWSEQPCEDCDGQGRYSTHDCNGGCDHTSLRGSLPLMSASRGAVKFNEIR